LIQEEILEIGLGIVSRYGSGTHGTITLNGSF
jgi:hypothetical protein